MQTKINLFVVHKQEKGKTKNHDVFVYSMDGFFISFGFSFDSCLTQKLAHISFPDLDGNFEELRRNRHRATCFFRGFLFKKSFHFQNHNFVIRKLHCGAAACFFVLHELITVDLQVIRLFCWWKFSVTYYCDFIHSRILLRTLLFVGNPSIVLPI